MHKFEQHPSLGLIYLVFLVFSIMFGHNYLSGEIGIIEVVLFNLLYYNVPMKEIRENISSKVIYGCEVKKHIDRCL